MQPFINHFFITGLTIYLVIFSYLLLVGVVQPKRERGVGYPHLIVNVLIAPTFLVLIVLDYLNNVF